MQKKMSEGGWAGRCNARVSLVFEQDLQEPTTTKRKKPRRIGPTVYLDSFLEPVDTLPRLLMLPWCLSLRRRIFAGAGWHRRSEDKGGVS